jgi:hypothetical protein
MVRNGLMSHVAMSVDRSTFTQSYLSDLAFYCDLLGWKIDENLSIPGERLLITLPGNGQYLNVRASDEPMVTTDYEHFGVYVESADAVHEAFRRVQAHQAVDDRVEIDERGVQLLYGGTLTTFRFKYLLPLSIEVQYIGEKGA